MFLLNAIFHIGPLKKNHLKFRQIQIVTMWVRSISVRSVRCSSPRHLSLLLSSSRLWSLSNPRSQ